MKKVIMILILLFLPIFFVTAREVTRQRLVGLDNYISYFSDNLPLMTPNGARVALNYLRVLEREFHIQFRELNGDQGYIDTELEWALASYYSPSVVQIRPPEADAILPANNPSLADQKLGAAVFQEMQILRFLGDTAAVSRHETVLQWIIDRGNVTRAEVEAFYRNNIRGLISDIVDEEFNKISFLSEGSPNGSYNAVLTRNPQNGHYILSYEGFFNGNRQTKTLTATLLETLSSEMSRTPDFNRATIDQLRAQARLIPAVALSQQAMNDITDFICSFCINVNQNSYAYLRDIIALYKNLEDTTGLLIYREITNAYARVLYELNPALERMVSNDGYDNRRYIALTTEQRQRLDRFR